MTKLLTVLAITSCYAEPPHAPRVAAKACHLGAPLGEQPVHDVPGYPVKLARLDDAARASAALALQQQAPNWSFQVDAYGFPIVAATADKLPDPVGAARALVEHLATAFAITRIDGVDHAPNDTYRMRGAPGETTFEITFRPLRVSATRHTIPLPDGVHELTDAELVARWGNDPDRGIVVDWFDRQSRCGYERGASCDADAPLDDCRRLDAIITRTVLEMPDGFRRVVTFDRPCKRDADAPCTERWIVPCTDAVTGELLPRLCQPLEPR